MANSNNMREIAKYIVVLIDAFASFHAISSVDAYLYLKRYGAIELIRKSHEEMQRKPVEEVVMRLIEHCESRKSSVA